MSTSLLRSLLASHSPPIWVPALSTHPMMFRDTTLSLHLLCSIADLSMLHFVQHSVRTRLRTTFNIPHLTEVLQRFATSSLPTCSTITTPHTTRDNTAVSTLRPGATVMRPIMVITMDQIATRLTIHILTLMHRALVSIPSRLATRMEQFTRSVSTCFIRRASLADIQRRHL